MKNKFKLVIGLFVLSQHLFAFTIKDSTFLNSQYLSENLNKTEFINSSFINCNFIESNLDSSKWIDVDFRLCTIKNSEYVRNIFLKNFHFDNGYLIDFSIYKSRINRVYFENSSIGNLEFHNCQINTLIIKNCTTSSIKIRYSNVQNIKIIGGSIDNIEFINDSSDLVEIGHIQCNQVSFKAGSISKVKLINIKFNSSSQIKFIETKIHFPRICNSDMAKIDFTRANFNFETFQLLNDYKCDVKKFSSSKSKSIYLEARDMYYLLNRQFQNAGITETQIQFEILMNEAYYKSKNHNISTWFSILWNKYFRGHYGLSPKIVIYTALVIWLIFGMFYIFLGQFTNVAWSLYMPLDIHGKVITSVQPRFVIQSTWNISFSYIKYCLLFSIQQLLMPSFSNSSLTFFKGIGFSQKLLIPIGIGKVLSFIQYIIGLLLLFNFIQAFIRTLN